jgi:hypothetical protein
MGLETLKSAERAAGFAMAPADDLEGRGEPTPLGRWQPADPLNMLSEMASDLKAVQLKAVQPSVTERVKGLFGFSIGRRAPA